MQGKLFCMIIVGLVTCTSQAQSEGPLGDLFLAKNGGLAHYSSYD